MRNRAVAKLSRSRSPPSHYHSEPRIRNSTITCQSALQFLCGSICIFAICCILFVGYLAHDEYKAMMRERAARVHRLRSRPLRKRYRPATCRPDSNSNASQSEIYYNGLAFIHVPKCGGTSIREMIGGVAASCNFISYVHEMPKWKTLKADRRFAAKVYGGLNHLTYYELGQSWPGTHMDTAAFFTTLRHPWDRLNSHYHYVKSLGAGVHLLFEETNSTPFDEWAASMTDGYILSFFVDRNITKAGGHELRRCCFDRNDLENAKKLLRKKFIIGLVEEPQRSIDLLRCRVSWVNTAIEANPNLGKAVHVNKGSIAYNVSDVGDAAIRRQFPLDYELYEYGRNLFYEQYNDCIARGVINGNNTTKAKDNR